MTRVVLPSFNFNDVDVISMCSVLVLPMVVVPAKFATPAPLCVTSNPADDNFAKLFESCIIFTSNVDADTSKSHPHH